MDVVDPRRDNTEVKALHGAGHLCWIEEADAVNTIILNSLKLAGSSS